MSTSFLSATGRYGRKRQAESGVDRNVPGLGRDTVEPGTDRPVRRQAEPALGRNVRVRVERDVRERERVADEVLAPLEMALHRGERAIARRHALVEPVGERLGTAGARDPEAHD